MASSWTSLVCALWLAAGLLTAPLAAAQSIVSTGQSFLDARFLSGIEEADGARVIGVRLSLSDGWKTYWRSPGEAGIPPHFDWTGSENLAAVEVLWPRPETFRSFGMHTIGYSGQVVLPVRLRPERAGVPMEIALTADIGVCRELCVIERVAFAERILPGAPPVGSAHIRRAMATVPRPAEEMGVRIVACRISGTGADLRLDAVLHAEAPLTRAEVLVEGSERIWITGAQTALADGTVHVSADVELPAGVAWVPRSDVRMTLLADGFAADLRGCTPSGG